MDGTGAEIICEECGARYVVRGAERGRRYRCKRCSAIIVVERRSQPRPDDDDAPGDEGGERALPPLGVARSSAFGGPPTDTVGPAGAGIPGLDEVARPHGSRSTLEPPPLATFGVDEPGGDTSDLGTPGRDPFEVDTSGLDAPEVDTSGLDMLEVDTMVPDRPSGPAEPTTEAHQPEWLLADFERPADDELAKTATGRAAMRGRVGATGRDGDTWEFGRYEIRGELGRGGMGVVYRGYDPTLRREVAIKTLMGGTSAHDAAVRRFEREARAIARLSHPNIVPVHESGEHEGTHYLVMEYVDGTTLAKVAKGEAANARLNVQIIAKCARALAYAHEQGIVHRDLKPANIMLDRRREPRIMDFGLAKEVEGSDQSVLSVTGDIMGTPHYMAPEQAEGRIRDIDRRTDIFSLGALLYHLLAGVPPFEGGSLADTLRQVLYEEPTALSTLNPRVPDELARIVTKALEKDPADRYQTAGALADDLERWLGGREISVEAPSIATRVTRSVSRRSRRPAVLRGLAAALALLSLGLGAALLLRDPLGDVATRLSDPAPDVRAQALRSLATDITSGRFGEPSLRARGADLMIDALADPATPVRLAALAGLRALRGDLAAGTDVDRRDRLATHLGPCLRQAAAEPDVAFEALDLVERLGLGQTQNALMALIQDPLAAQSLVLRAIRVLGLVGRMGSVPALMAVMGRGGVYRQEAMLAIELITAPRTDEDAALQDGDSPGSVGSQMERMKALQREVAQSRFRSQRELERLGYHRSPKPEQDVLRDTLTTGRQHERMAAIAKLARDRVTDRIEILRAALENTDPLVAEAAAGALASIGGQSVRLALEEDLKILGVRGRTNAARGLGYLADPASTDALLEALRGEPESAVRAEVLKALGRMGDRNVAVHLIAMLDQPDAALSAAAREGLTTLFEHDFGADPAAWRRVLRGPAPSPPPGDDAPAP